MPQELPACPVETTLLLIGDKWKVIILRELLKRTQRFGELRQAIPGISPKMLTQQLRSMERDGLLQRTAYAEVPPRVEYSLTPTGRSLDTVLNALTEWGEAYQAGRR